MLGTVEVVPQDEYEDWLAEQKSGGDGSEDSGE
jgi:cytochrome c oxidase subunit 2